MTSQEKKGHLITFEGIECSGKGTQIKLLRAWLASQGMECVSNHEPGGTLYGEALRMVLKNPELALPAIFKAVKGHSDYETINAFELADKTNYSRSGLFEMFLFMASRTLYAEQVKWFMAHDISVMLSDRLMDSTTAYQGSGKFYDDPKMLEAINYNNRLAMDGLWPDLTFLIDVPLAVMYKRMAGEDEQKNSFFEQKYDRETYQRIREGYLEIARQEPNRVKVIDGTMSIEEVFEAIKNELSIYLKQSQPEEGTS